MRVSVRRLALYPLFAAQRSGALQSPFLHQISPRSRTLFSETGVWEKDYRTETRRKVEGWWHPRIMAQWRKDAVEEVRGSFKVSNNKLKIKWMIVLLLVTSSYKKTQNSVYIWHSKCSSFLSQFRGMHVDLIGGFWIGPEIDWQSVSCSVSTGIGSCPTTILVRQSGTCMDGNALNPIIILIII